VDKRLCKFDALLHSRRVFLDAAVSGFFELKVSKDFVRTALRLPSTESTEFAGERDVFDARQPRHERLGFGHESDESAEQPVVGGVAVAAERLAEDGSSTGSGRDESEEDFEEGGFARAIRTEQADPSGRQLEREVVEGREVAEGAAEAVEFEERRHVV
jgi:hypothetical protein